MNAQIKSSVIKTYSYKNRDFKVSFSLPNCIIFGTREVFHAFGYNPEPAMHFLKLGKTITLDQLEEVSHQIHGPLCRAFCAWFKEEVEPSLRRSVKHACFKGNH